MVDRGRAASCGIPSAPAACGAAVSRYRFARFELDATRRTLGFAGEPVPVGARAFDLLLALVEARGAVVAKTALLERIWPGQIVEEGNLQTQASLLRRALGSEGPSLVVTDPRRGYRLAAEISRIEPSPGPQRTDPADTASRHLGPGPPSDPAEPPLLAVLPFRALGGDAADTALAAGITDELTTTLARIRSFRVLAQASGARLDGRDDAAALGLHYLVSGSLQRGGTRLRVNVTLASVATGATLWGSRVDGSDADVFGLQDQVADAVAAAVDPNLRRAETERLRTRPPERPDAYASHLRGVAELHPIGWASCERALWHLSEALRLDPLYAPALAAAAWCHMWRASQVAGHAAFEEEARAAVDLAERAERVVGDDPIALARIGLVFGFLGHRADTALRLAARAVELHPNGVLPRSSAGWVHVYGDDPEPAIAHFDEAVRLDPLDPELGLPLSGIAFAHLLADRPGLAVEAAERAVAASPGIASAHRVRAAALGLAGQSAGDAVAALLALAPGFTVSGFDHVRRHLAKGRLFHVVRAGLLRAGVPAGDPPAGVTPLRGRGAE